MKKIYSSFLGSFKEYITEINRNKSSNKIQQLKINAIAESIFSLEKISKFVEIFEILEDFSDYFKIYLVNNIK